MTTQQSILKATLQAIQEAYFAGRPLGRLIIQEGGDLSTFRAISIDLYEEDAPDIPVCDGLIFPTAEPDTGKTVNVEAFSVYYNPDNDTCSIQVEECLAKDFTSWDVPLDKVPDTVCANITNWLREQVRAQPIDAVCDTIANGMKSLKKK